MNDPSTVRLPARLLADLADRCGRADADAVAALREAGREIGTLLLGELDADDDPTSAPADEFWTAVADALAERGLGALEVRVRTPSVAELRLEAGPEATGREREHPGCPFSTGLLAGVASEAADAPVAVLEVACAGDGQEACRWLAGAEDSLEQVRESLEEGVPLEEALEGP